MLPPTSNAAPAPLRHRASAVLGLGLCSIAVSLLSLACCAPLGLIGLGTGISAIIMGHADLKQMRAGRMDASGHSHTQLGFICGIVGTAVGTLLMMLMILALVIYGSLFGLAVMAGPQ